MRCFCPTTPTKINDQETHGNENTKLNSNMIIGQNAGQNQHRDDDAKHLTKFAKLKTQTWTFQEDTGTNETNAEKSFSKALDFFWPVRVVHDNTLGQEFVLIEFFFQIVLELEFL